MEIIELVSKIPEFISQNFWTFLWLSLLFLTVGIYCFLSVARLLHLWLAVISLWVILEVVIVKMCDLGWLWVEKSDMFVLIASLLLSFIATCLIVLYPVRIIMDILNGVKYRKRRR